MLKQPTVGGLKGLSEATGIQRVALEKYATGKSRPHLRTWQSIAAFIRKTQGEQTLFDGNTSMGNGNSMNETTQQDKAYENTTSLVLSTLDTAQEDVYLDQEFFLPISGYVRFDANEKEIINHPAFQRLGGLNQLGLAHLVYRGATHRRIEHALGTVGAAQKIIDHLQSNARKIKEPDFKDLYKAGAPPTELECRFIRLAALLHDIGHVPFGHSFEDELHILNKHDGVARLNKVFEKTVWSSFVTESLGSLVDRLYTKYLSNSTAASLSPLGILRGLILRAKENTEVLSPEGPARFAAAGIRLIMCRDIIGNTICSDLLDYLFRDWHHIGKPRYIDDRIFQYMEICTPRNNPAVPGQTVNPHKDDVFVVSIGKSPKLRTDGISAILEVLESRYSLSEAVLFHRTKLRALAMLERLLRLAMSVSADQKNSEKFQTDLENWLLENPEESLLPALIEGRSIFDNPVSGASQAFKSAQRIAADLLQRRLYKPIVTQTYHQLNTLTDFVQRTYGDGAGSHDLRESALSTLEQDFNLTKGSIAMCCPESRMNAKIADVRILVEGNIEKFKDYEGNHSNNLSAGHLEAQLERFQSLWKIGFYASDEVLAKGPEFKRVLISAINTLVLGIVPQQETLESVAQQIAEQLTKFRENPFYQKIVLDGPRSIVLNRSAGFSETESYPTGAPAIRRFIG